MNVYDTESQTPRRRYLWAQSETCPDEQWIRRYTGIAWNSVTRIDKVRVGRETCWMIFIKKEKR